MQNNRPKVAQVLPESIAAEVGIEPDFVLMAINGEEIEDILDYRWALAAENLTLLLSDADGAPWEVEIEKEYGEDLGLIFEYPTLAPIQRCHNNCLFCFVAQLPRGVRSSLMVKDDDYRLSSLHGSFVTLTNLDDHAWERLITMRPSPLYVSVHTTNGPLRAKMMNNPKAALILQQLKTLAQHKIEVHCQIVLVPDFNDDHELEKTLNDLKKLWPSVQSVAIVPVGLTAHRLHLPKLRPFDPKTAAAVIKSVSPFQEQAKEECGLSFIYLADEFFLLAGEPIPPKDYYDDFPQKENGIGLVRLFLDQIHSSLTSLPSSITKERHVVWVTGHLAAPVLRKIAETLRPIGNLRVDVLPVANNFFGEAITVTGLLTGRDILAALTENMPASATHVLIPAVALREFDGDFLDDMSFATLVAAFPEVQIMAVDNDGVALIDSTLGRE